jgi:hypothetical protein
MPPLWSAEGKDIEKDVWNAVPVGEIYFYELALQHQASKQ